MKINKAQTNMTVMTSAKKAFHVADILKRQDRFETVIRYDNYKKGIVEYYIFYRNYIF